MNEQNSHLSNHDLTAKTNKTAKHIKQTNYVLLLPTGHQRPLLPLGKIWL